MSDLFNMHPNRLNNLPMIRAGVVGRDEAIRSLLEMLDIARLVSIVGTGGVGKTTVALEVASQAGDWFKDGVWMVDLSTLKEPALVPNAISTAIGSTGQSANMLATLSSALQDKQLLLILDNCEHLIEAAATVAHRLLASTNHIKILATSREPLSVKGERIKRLTGLTVPPARPALTAEAALGYSAVELFVKRAIDRDADFQLNAGNAAIVATICRRLDGVALAIELAATRIDAFGVDALLQQLDDRFRLLQGYRSGPERHRTLAALVNWSYDLLSEGQQRVMRGISIFAGAFGLDAACAIVGDTVERSSVLDDLCQLVAKSLVSVEGTGDAVEYRLLDTNRHFAFQKLSETRDLGAACQRHAAYALRLAEQAKADVSALSTPLWFERYRPKIDDIRDALMRAYSTDYNPGLLVKLTVATIPYWEQLSLLEECKQAVERALEPQFRSARTERDDLILHLSLGATLLFTRGPLPEAKLALSHALEIAHSIGNIPLELECLRGLSQHAQWAGDSRESLAVSERIRAITLPEGEAASSRNADGQAGTALQQMGALHAARLHLESFLASPVQSSGSSDFSRFEFDQRLEARGALAMVVWLLGYPETALTIAAEQMEAAKASNFAVPYCAAVLLTWTCITLYVGEFEATERALDTIEAYTVEHGLTLWTAMATCMRVKTNIDMNKPVDRNRYWEVLDYLGRGGFGLRYPPFLGNFGHLLSRDGDHIGALSAIDQALSLYTDAGQDWGIPEMLTMKGNFIRASLHSGWLEAASDCYTQSIEMARKQGTLTWELRAATQLVEMWRGQGGNAEAEAALASAFGRFEEGFGTLDLRRAKTLLDGADRAAHAKA